MAPKSCNIKYSLFPNIDGCCTIYIWIYMALQSYKIEYLWYTVCPLFLNIHAHIQQYPPNNRHWPKKRKNKFAAKQNCCHLPPPSTLSYSIHQTTWLCPTPWELPRPKTVSPSSRLSLWLVLDVHHGSSPLPLLLLLALKGVVVVCTSHLLTLQGKMIVSGNLSLWLVIDVRRGSGTLLLLLLLAAKEVVICTVGCLKEVINRQKVVLDDYELHNPTRGEKRCDWYCTETLWRAH